MQFLHVCCAHYEVLSSQCYGYEEVVCSAYEAVSFSFQISWQQVFEVLSLSSVLQNCRKCDSYVSCVILSPPPCITMQCVHFPMHELTSPYARFILNLLLICDSLHSRAPVVHDSARLFILSLILVSRLLNSDCSLENFSMAFTQDIHTYRLF